MQLIFGLLEKNCSVYLPNIGLFPLNQNAMKTQDILIAHPSDAHEMSVIKAFFEALKIKFEVAKDLPYDLEFVAKIENSRKQASEGKTVKINRDDIWK
jgi:hypothetical protein